MLKIKIKDLIIYGVILLLVFLGALEIYKIKHQLKFATYMEQQNRNTVWIQNFSNSIQQAQAAQQKRAVQQQQPTKLEKTPEKK